MVELPPSVPIGGATNAEAAAATVDAAGYDASRGIAERPVPPGGAPAGSVVGVGIDVVAVARFAAALCRTPALADRLFAAAERLTPTGRPRRDSSLAARFAVKEAVAKALGAPRGMEWHDCRIEQDASGRPVLETLGTVAAAATARGVTRWEISMTHDGGIASAIAIALR